MARAAEESTMVEGWEHLPMELLDKIISLADDRTAIIALGVCTNWRNSVFSTLTHLSLSWSKHQMNKMIDIICPNFKCIQVLNLRQTSPQLEDTGVEAVALHCHQLQELDISKSLNLTDRSLIALANGCPKLTKLVAPGCTNFTDSSLAYLAGLCTRMRYLHLCGCLQAVTDVALQSIARNCPELQVLNIAWCKMVSDVGVTSLAVSCPDLRTLDLCDCVLITDESVVALANGCRRLKSLDLYYCQNITDRAMYSLANSGYVEEGLTNLNIGQCTKLTAPAVQAVCDSFPMIHTCFDKNSLTISGCHGLTSVRCGCSGKVHHRY